MKASIKLIASKSTKDGHPICVELFISSKERTRKTIGYTQAEFWNKDKSEILKLHPHYYLLMPVILENKAKCFKVNYGNFTPDEAKDILFDDQTTETETGFIDFFNVRIHEKSTKGETCETYKNVKHIIGQYIFPQKDIPINKITYEWLNTFMHHKLQTGCKAGGVMSYFRTMRAVYKEAQRRQSLKVKQDNPFLGIMKTPTPKEVIRLYPEHINTVRNFTPNKNTQPGNAKKQQRSIALWLFQFYIGGHDLVDVAMLQWHQVEKRRIKLKRHKNRNKKNGGPLVDNKLFDEALHIIDTYGNKSTDRVFSFIPCPVTDYVQYTYFRRTYNESLERTSKTLNLPEPIKSKSPRYLFRTFSGELLVHDLVIMTLQGHTPQGVTFSYQRTLSHSVMDKAHRDIIDFVMA